MNYLLDTCVISDFFKKIPLVIEHFKSVSPEQIFISAITVMEVEYGLKLNTERAKKLRPMWKELLEFVEVVPYTAQCAEVTGSIRTDLKKKGLPIGPYDILIAGTAIVQDMVLVTSNTGEFQRIGKLKFIDWRIDDNKRTGFKSMEVE